MKTRRHLLPTPPASEISSVSVFTKKDIHLALLDPTSSDPPSDPSPVPATSSTFKKKFIDHLQPLNASKRSLEKINKIGSTGKRGVVFSLNHLASLDATPNHRYNPYERLHTYSSSSVPSSKVRSSRHSITGSVNHQPTQPIRRPTLIKLDLGLPTPNRPRKTVIVPEEEPGTDDEADAMDVSELLLSTAPPSTAPSTEKSSTHSLTPSVYSEPRSILKSWSLAIPLVENAVEGSRKNGGRVKHMLNFDYSIASSPIESPETAMRIEVSPYFHEKVLTCGTNGLNRTVSVGTSKEGNGNTGKASSGKENAFRSGIEISSKGKGGNDGDDFRRKPPVPSTSTISGVPSTPVTTDIVSALETIKASLRPLSAAYIRQQRDRDETEDNGETVPRAINGRSPSITKLLAQDAEEGLRVPILLPQVENAYVALTKGLLELIAKGTATPAKLQPLVTFQRFLFAALDRDIINCTLEIPSTAATIIVRGNGRTESSSSPIESKKSTGKKGMPAVEMRRMKDETNVAQAAIKCIACIAREPLLYSLLPELNIANMVESIINITKSPFLSPTVIKDILPFHNWFFATQRLPTAFIDRLAPRILSSIKITLKANDKARRILQFALMAFAQLIKSHPAFFLENYKSWLAAPANGLSDWSKNGVLARAEALVTLGTVVKGVWTSWTKDEDAAGKAKREKIGGDISSAFLSILHSSRGADPAFSQTFFENLSNAIKKPDEVPWALSVLALLPALLGKSFRYLHKKGLKPWMEVMNDVTKGDKNNSPVLRSLSHLAWNHLIFAFLQSSSTAVRSNSTFSAHFIVDHFDLVNQIFTTSVWSSVTTLSAVNSMRSKVLLRVLVGLIFALSIEPHLPLALPGVPEIDKSQREVEYFDRVWTKLVEKQLTLALESVCDETAVIAFNILAAIVKEPSTTPLDPTILLVDGFLDGTLARIRSPITVPRAVAPIMDGACDEMVLSGWSVDWTTRRAGVILELFGKCLNRMGRIKSDTVVGSVSKSEIIVPALLTVWKNFLSTLVASRVSDTTGIQTIFNFLFNLSTSIPLLDCTKAQRVELVNLLLMTVYEILGTPLLARIEVQSMREHFSKRILSTASLSSSNLLITTLLEFEKTHSSSLVALTFATEQLLKQTSPANGFESMRTDLLTRWTQKLEKNVDLTENAASVIADLLTLHLSTVDFLEDQWLDFAKLFTKIFLSNPVCYSALLGKASLPATTNIELVVLLLGTSRFLSLKVDYQTRIIDLIDAQLPAILVSSRTHGLKFSTVILQEAGPEIFAATLGSVLSALSVKIESTAEHLELLSPILDIALQRALGDYEVPTGIDTQLCVPLITNFWKNHFDRVPIPEKLKYNVEILMAGAYAEDSQTQTQTQNLSMGPLHSTMPMGKNKSVKTPEIELENSLEMPTAAQRSSSIIIEELVDSGESSMESIRGINPSPSGYTADVSTSQMTQNVIRPAKMRRTTRTTSSPSLSIGTSKKVESKRKLRKGSSLVGMELLATSQIGFRESEMETESSEAVSLRRDSMRRERESLRRVVEVEEMEEDDAPVVVSGRKRSSSAKKELKRKASLLGEISPVNAESSSAGSSASGSATRRTTTAGGRKESVSPSQRGSILPRSVISTGAVLSNPAKRRKSSPLDSTKASTTILTRTEAEISISTIPETLAPINLLPATKIRPSSLSTISSAEMTTSQSKKEIISAFLNLEESEILEMMKDLGNSPLLKLMQLGKGAGEVLGGESSGGKGKGLASSEI